MKTIKYANKEIQYKIKKNKDKTLMVCLKMLLEKYDNVIFRDILDVDDTILLSFSNDKGDFIFNIDKLNHRFLLSSSLFPYQEEYSTLGDYWTFLGRIYQSNNQTVYLASSFVAQNHHFHYKNGSIRFDVSIHGLIDEEQIVRCLLTITDDIKILDLLRLLEKMIDLKNVTLKISQNDNSILVIYNGVLTKYVDYENRDGVIYKTYLEDEKFYVEKTTKEEMHEDLMPFVKKMTKKEK